MCHCQTFCANGRLHDTFVNVNPQNTIATQFCDESFTTIKADHRVLQHIYTEHFLICNFLRLGFEIINLTMTNTGKQRWCCDLRTMATNFFLPLTPAKIPFGVISQSRWHCNALAGQIVPGAQLGRAIAEIRPMYWDLRSFLRTCHISGGTHFIFSRKMMHLSYPFINRSTDSMLI